MAPSGKDGRRLSSITNRRDVLKAMGGASIAGLAGCTGGPAEPEGTDTEPPQSTTVGSPGEWPDLSGSEVHFLTDEANEPTQQIYQRIIDEFEQETNATVNIEYVPFDQFNQRVAQLLQANTPPELVLTTTSDTANYIELGVAEPATAAFEQLEEQYGTPPEGSRVVSEGDEYLIPLWTNSGMNHYRSDISDIVTDTWDNELAYAEEADGTDGLAGTFVPGGKSVCTDQMVISYGFANGAQLATRENGEVTIIMADGNNRTRWVEMLEHIQQLSEYSPDAPGAGCGGMTQAVPNEVSAEAYYIGARPKIQSVLQEKAFAADVHPIKTPSGRTDQHSGFVEGLQMFRGGDKRAAEVFMEFFYQLENFVDLALQTPIHNNPGWPGIRDSDPYRQGLDELPDTWSDQDIDQALAAIEGVRTLDGETNPPNPWAGPLRASRKFSEMFFEVTANDADPAAVVDQKAQEFQEVLDDARG